MAIKLTDKQIQNGWQMIKFAEIAKNISQRIEPSETNLNVYVGLEHLDPQSLRITRRGVPSDVQGQKLRVRPGQIIFGKRRAYQKKVAVADFDGICSAHAMVLEAIPGKIIPELLPFFMQSDMFMDRAVAISEGSLSPTIKWKTLAIQQFPLPPLDRQKKILEVLKKVEENDKIIYEAIQSNILAQRVTRINLLSPENSGSNISTTLGKISEIIMGQSPKGNEYLDKPTKDSLPLLNGPTEFGMYTPMPVQYTEAITKIAEKSDILFCVRGSTTGRMNIANQRYCIGRGLAAIRGKENASSTNLIRQILILVKDKIFEQAKGSGSTFPNISSSELKKWQIRSIPYERQDSIVAGLSILEEVLVSLEREKHVLIRIKKQICDLFLFGVAK